MRKATAPESGAVTRAQLRVIRNRKRRRMLVVHVAVIVLAGLALAGVMRFGVIRGFFIPSESMEPTLGVDDRVAVDIIGPSLVGYKRGDIVVFPEPGMWASEEAYEPTVLQQFGIVPESGDYFVKRVIGLPGDTVRGLEDGTVFVNDVELRAPEKPATSQEPFTVTLRPGEVWVMGDNRDHSADSRMLGPVKESALVGRVMFTYYDAN